ncbi:cache domain-containing protein, partial [bacterium]|nr:cache domain-containing protein [bacterium]
MLKNLPIGARLTLMVAVMTAALAMVAAVAVQQLYNQLLAERQRHTRELVETAVSHVDELHRQAEEGRMAKDEAKARALEEIAALRYNGRNYFWVTDTRPVLLAHPEAPDLVGRNVDD